MSQKYQPTVREIKHDLERLSGYASTFESTVGNLLQRSLQTLRKGKSEWGAHLRDMRDTLLKTIGSDLLNKQIAGFKEAVLSKLDIKGVFSQIAKRVSVRSGASAVAIAHQGAVFSDRTGRYRLEHIQQLPRYHFGGIVGLKPNEVPAILQKGEEVITRADPRHRLNHASPTPPPINIDARGADPAAIARLHAILPQIRQLASRDALVAIAAHNRRLGR